MRVKYENNRVKFNFEKNIVLSKNKAIVQFEENEKLSGFNYKIPLDIKNLYVYSLYRSKFLFKIKTTFNVIRFIWSK